MKRLVPVLTLVAGLQACSVIGPAPTGPGAAGTGASRPEPAAVAVPSPGSAIPPDTAAASAAATMLSQAREQRAAGALPAAESTIERALRVEPNDPWLWIELGEIKLQTGDAQQAATMARKALSLAAGDRDIERRANALLRAR